LKLPVNRYWNGEACDEVSYCAQVWLSHSEAGVTIKAQAQVYKEQLIPVGPIDKPFDGLWDYDVVELFLVAASGHYLEVELGAGGHWLVLGFDGVRHRSNDYADFKPELNYDNDGAVWTSTIVIPWNMIPQPVTSLNAYAICQGQFLAYTPVPGVVADYHQPSTFPEAEIEA
jgi:hypothetical protein